MEHKKSIQDLVAGTPGVDCTRVADILGPVLRLPNRDLAELPGSPADVMVRQTTLYLKTHFHITEAEVVNNTTFNKVMSTIRALKAYTPPVKENVPNVSTNSPVAAA